MLFNTDNNNDDDDDDDDDQTQASHYSNSSSADEALAEMLGLEKLNSITMHEVNHNEIHVISDNSEIIRMHNNNNNPEVESVAIPPNCARDEDTPEIAWYIHNVLSRNECQDIIDKAEVSECVCSMAIYLYIRISKCVL